MNHAGIFGVFPKFDILSRCVKLWKNPKNTCVSHHAGILIPHYYISHKHIHNIKIYTLHLNIYCIYLLIIGIPHRYSIIYEVLLGVPGSPSPTTIWMCDLFYAASRIIYIIYFTNFASIFITRFVYFTVFHDRKRVEYINIWR